MKSEARKLLVLDGQGVVFNAPIKLFLAEFARCHRIPLVAVEQRWETGVREVAWRGLVDDATLWRRLAGREVDASRTRRALDAGYHPGPATGHVPEWSKKATLWLLSNHRCDWLVPRLDALGIGDRFERLLISDQTGALKPESAAFEPIIHRSSPLSDVLFVDDQPHNVAAASALGIRSIVASPGTHWLEHVDDWLTASSR